MKRKRGRWLPAILGLTFLVPGVLPASMVVSLDPDETPPTIEVISPPAFSLWTGKETLLWATFSDPWPGWGIKAEARLDGDSRILEGCLDHRRLDCALLLAPGRHRLELEVMDYAGCKTAAEHTFEIYDPAADIEPPVAEFLAPHRGETIVSLDHNFTLRIADPEPGSGLAPKGFVLEVDGRDFTSSCTFTAAGLVSCRGVRLDEGDHLAVAKVRDRMGNVGRASRRFSNQMWQGSRSTMPKLELVSPQRLLASTATEVPIRLRFDDAGIGIAEGSLRVKVKDEDISSGCVRTADGAECRARMAADGWYGVFATVSNWEGNKADIYEVFYRLSGTDDIPPTVELLYPAEEVAVETNRPTLRFCLGDEGSAIGRSFGVEIDGNWSFCMPRPLAQCRVNQWLSPGRHVWKAEVADAAGNKVAAAGSFEVSAAAADQAAPEIRLESRVLREGRDHGLSVRYYDPHSGVRAESVEVTVDGLDITGACTARDHGVFCPGPFASGSHRAEVMVADHEGNWSAISFAFEFRPLDADRLPPLLELATPAGGDLHGSALASSPAFCVTFGDGESGSDRELLSVEVAGLPVWCFDSSGGDAECYVSGLPPGPARVEAKVADRAGNLTTVAAEVEIRPAAPELPSPILTSGSPAALVRLVASSAIVEDWLERGEPGIVPRGGLDGDEELLDDCLQGLRADPPRCVLPALEPGRHRLTLSTYDGPGRQRQEVLDFEVVAD